jgi:hypothetical protein
VPLRVTRDHALAFRATAHYLSERRPVADLHEIVSRAPVRNAPPGTAPIALGARVDGLTKESVERALLIDKTLLQVWSRRGSPHVIRTRDVGVFTIGLLPDDEDSVRHVLEPFTETLDQKGIGALEAFERVSREAYAALDGNEMSRGEFSGALSKRLPKDLTPWCEGCGVYHVNENAFRYIGLRGDFCLTSALDEKVHFMRLDKWLGRQRPRIAKRTARAEAVRRYLAAYGPSTPEEFADWVGTTPAWAERAWRPVGHDLAEVDFDGRRAWVLESDVPHLRNAKATDGVRLLPAHDPYLTHPDRTTLVPVREHQKELWRAQVNSGAVLVNGAIVGAWRMQRKGRVLNIPVRPFGKIGKRTLAAVEAEAQIVASLRTCTTARLDLDR